MGTFRPNTLIGSIISPGRRPESTLFADEGDEKADTFKTQTTNLQPGITLGPVPDLTQAAIISYR